MSMGDNRRPRKKRKKKADYKHSQYYYLLNSYDYQFNYYSKVDMEKETEKQKLIAELNQLSENFEKNKQRMIEIAKILLHDHY